MKRIFLSSALIIALAAPLGAQSLSDAYRFGGIDYLGTARSMALGGAMGAVGCDLGSIGINPAGSAVAGYSQFVVTPGLSLASAQSSYALTPSNDFGAPQAGKRTSFALPNIGASARYDSYSGSALKSFTLAFVVNTTSDYNSHSYASGVNDRTSKFAEMASAAGGINKDYLASSGFYNDSDYYNYWDVAMGYDVGLIHSYTDSDYVGCTELLTDLGTHYVPGELIQKSSNVTAGAKSDILMNMAFNFSDKLYLGINLGLPVINYSSAETLSEVAVQPELFPIVFNYDNGGQQTTYFSNATYQYNYWASGAGVYAKFGAIWLPFSGLRLGFAYQTPTAFNIEETWAHSGSVAYLNGSKYSGSSRTGTYEYSYTAPQAFDFSAAFTFGRLGLVSVDYTLSDYHHIGYSENTVNGSDYFDFTNTAMRAFSGVGHNLRVGAEINLTPDFALRAGYSLRTSPEKYYIEGDKTIAFGDYNEDYYLGRLELPKNSYYYDEYTQSFSAGLGYNPAGSFFADLAVRFTQYPDSYYQPYYGYAGMDTPQIRIASSLINAALTIGWRF